MALSHKLPSQGFRLGENLRSLVDIAKVPDPARPDEFGLLEAHPFVKGRVLGVNVREPLFIGVALAQNHDQPLVALQPMGFLGGFVIGHEKGEGPIDKGLELSRYVAVKDRRGHHQNIRLSHRIQHLGEIVLEHAGFGFALAAVAGLASFEIHLVEHVRVDRGAIRLGRFAEDVGYGGTVPFLPGTAVQTNKLRGQVCP
jgi:hypothetical protein